MRIAITGGSGRIGRAVTTLALDQGHSVVIIDRVHPPEAVQQTGISFVGADMAQFQELERALRGCDALVHLAAIPSPGHHPDHEVHNNNVTGSYNALSAAAQLGITHVCQASSINATGAAYSRHPHFDYFPLDEHHPTYNEDPYSLSKWICEQQADSIARRHAGMTIASLRFHWIVPDRATAMERGATITHLLAKQLWGYTNIAAAAQACLLSITAGYTGHEVFQIVAPETMMAAPSLELARQYFPETEVRGDLSDTRGFYDCSKAERLIGWRHV